MQLSYFRFLFDCATYIPAAIYVMTQNNTSKLSAEHLTETCRNFHFAHSYHFKLMTSNDP